MKACTRNHRWVPSARRTSGRGRPPCPIGAIRERQSKPQSNPSLFPPSHFGSKASFLRRDLRTLNYSRSYRKRRKEGERKEKKRKFCAKAEGRSEPDRRRSCRSINGNIHTAVTDNREERREGRGEGQARTSCTSTRRSFIRSSALY